MDRGVALITGGSRGIGAAIARAAADQGWTVCLTYRQDEAAARQVAHAVKGAAVRADISSEADVVNAFNAAEELGTLTAVVANAGIVGARTRVQDLSKD